MKKLLVVSAAVALVAAIVVPASAQQMPSPKVVPGVFAMPAVAVEAPSSAHQKVVVAGVFSGPPYVLYCAVGYGFDPINGCGERLLRRSEAPVGVVIPIVKVTWNSFGDPVVGTAYYVRVPIGPGPGIVDDVH